MISRIETINEKKLIGQRMRMSLADYRVAALWQSFMPRRKEIINALSSDLISLAVYSPTHFTQFNPGNTFEKWAAVEVASFDHVPNGMETFIVPGGSYAVFHYKGSSAESFAFFQSIFSDWLPSAGYLLDDRPHFEVLGEKYRNNDPSSEEEIWIPVKGE